MTLQDGAEMARHERRASIAAFRRDAMRRDVETFLIDGTDSALLRPPFSQATMYWRANIAVRKPKCAAACGTSFAADGVAVGGWLSAQPVGATAVSVSAFCNRCWSSLDDRELERAAMKVLLRIKPHARFADAPSDK